MFHITVISLQDKHTSHTIFTRLDKVFRNDFKDRFSRHLHSHPHVSIDYLNMDKTSTYMASRPSAADAYIILSEESCVEAGESLRRTLKATRSKSGVQPPVVHKNLRLKQRPSIDCVPYTCICINKHESERLDNRRRATFSHFKRSSTTLHEDKKTFCENGSPVVARRPTFSDMIQVRLKKPKHKTQMIKDVADRTHVTDDVADITAENLDHEQSETDLVDAYLGRLQGICSLQDSLLGRLDILNKDIDKNFKVGQRRDCTAWQNGDKGKYVTYVRQQNQPEATTSNGSSFAEKRETMISNVSCFEEKRSPGTGYRFHAVLQDMHNKEIQPKLKEDDRSVDVDISTDIDVHSIFDELLQLVIELKPKRRHTASSVMNRLVSLKARVASRLPTRARSNTIF